MICNSLRHVPCVSAEHQLIVCRMRFKYTMKSMHILKGKTKCGCAGGADKDY